MGEVAFGNLLSTLHY